MSDTYDGVTQTPLQAAADETLEDVPKSKGGGWVEIRGCHHARGARDKVWPAS